MTIMLTSKAVTKILTSTLLPLTTAEPSFFGENGLTLIIIASALILIGLMILCCYCAANPAGGNGSRRRIRTVLPTHAPPPETTTTVARSQSTIYANQKGQPILKTYKVSTTRSSSSGESIHAAAIKSQSNNRLLPSTNNHHLQHQQPLPQRQPQSQQQVNTNPFYEDIPLDTVSAPRDLTHDYYERRGLRQYSSDI